MRFLPLVLLWAFLACSSVSAYAPFSFSAAALSSASSASSSSSATSSDTATFGGKAHHLKLTAHNKLEGRPKKIQKTHEGMELQTVDGVISGCPSLDFSATVGIGGQSFQLIVDTGSTTLGVASSSCSCGNTSPMYTPGSSSAFLTKTQQAFYSKYGDGSYWYAAGYSDTVSVGGSIAAATTFAAISSQSNFFSSHNCAGSSSSPSQGIMGFAGSRLAASAQDGSGVNAQQWFAQYQAAAKVPDIFALQMCLNSGDLWLGGYDNLTFSGQLHWVSIQPYTINQGGSQFTLAPGTGYYTVTINSIGLTGFAADTTSSDYNGVNVNSIVDSGTTLMIIPTAAYNAIVNALTSNYATQFSTMFGVSPSNFFSSGNCYAPTAIASVSYVNSNLPTLQVILGGAANNVPLTLTLNAGTSYLQETTISGNRYYCSGIAGSSGGTTILGWSFINQFIVAHDLRNLKLGFAPRTGCKDGSAGAVSAVGGETGVADAAIQGGSVTSNGAAGGGSDSGNPSSILNSISGLSTTTIIIIVVSIVAGLIVLLALCWCCQSSRKSDEQQQHIIEQQRFGKV